MRPRDDKNWDELLTALIEANFRIDERELFCYWTIEWEAVTKFIRIFFPNAKREQLYQRWYRTLEPGLITGRYTDDETKLLCDLVAHYGGGKIDWGAIKRIMRRSTKSLRDRYNKYARNSLVRSRFEPAECDVIEAGCTAGHNQKRITDDLNTLLRQRSDLARSVGEKHGIEKPMRSVVDVENYLKTLASYKRRSNAGRPGSAKKARHLEEQKTAACAANDSMLDVANLLEMFCLDLPDLQDAESSLDEIALIDWPSHESDTMRHWFDEEPGPVAPSTHFGVHANVDLYAPCSQVPRDASVEPVDAEPASRHLFANLQRPSADVDLDSLEMLLTRIAQHHVALPTSTW
ncbi:hypothetical protein SDRG_02402 [Saprolegnia diclina VS20]|uniref:Myb-like domain-containing protein n=1 Tax=Saprolegnia diclina (strain VS20) TaxID=1156394 RepID=T0R0Q2_SAPDV|nr:hypothetical protein SDRG_02402 [Saprolegnia diclina VS20]EQC40511.1 hypothetical protein SDRG_02402 [Saprolegnia diclina VS20]|eukprot:XP_008606210.1 hypothetical protein SDRG_02402 [Saprolegnia diclina VS20]